MSVSILPTAKKTADPAASVAHVAVHAVVDAEGLPKAPKLTEGLAHDGRSACDMLDALVEGQTLLVNRAYGSDATRQSLTKRGVAAFSKGPALTTVSCSAIRQASSSASIASSLLITWPRTASS